MLSPVRVLFTFAGGLGHLNPLLPLATLMRSAGHQIALAGRADVVENRAGFDAVFPYALANRVELDESTGALVRPDLRHEVEVVGDYFVNKLGRKNAELSTAAIQSWQPHLVVCDEMDFGSMVAAERAGIPIVVVKVIASGALVRPRQLNQQLNSLRKFAGLAHSTLPLMLDGDLVVAPFPPSFRDPRFPLPRTAHSVRPEPAEQFVQHPAVDWLSKGDEELRIYFTLGTIFNTESGDLFARIATGLQELPARILITVGPNIDPESIPIRAKNVRLERCVPQNLVLPRVNLVVNHGGSGSVIGALSQGIPLVVVPLGADQEFNAQRVKALGAGIVLDPIRSTSADAGNAVEELLSSRPATVAAQTIRNEIETLPLSSTLLPVLERLATNGRVTQPG